MDSLQSEVWLLLFYREEFSESEQPVEHKATLQLEIHACDIEHLHLVVLECVQHNLRPKLDA